MINNHFFKLRWLFTEIEENNCCFGINVTLMKQVQSHCKKTAFKQELMLALFLSLTKIHLHKDFPEALAFISLEGNGVEYPEIVSQSGCSNCQGCQGGRY